MWDAVQQTNSATKRGTPRIGVFSQVGRIVAIAALIGASCCAHPLLLGWLGLAGAWIANLGILGRLPPVHDGVCDHRHCARLDDRASPASTMAHAYDPWRCQRCGGSSAADRAL